MYLFNRHLRHCLKFQRIHLQQQKKCNFETTNVAAPVPNLDVLPVFANVQQHPNRIALQDTHGSYTYANLFLSAKNLANDISNKIHCSRKENVLFLCENNIDYVVTLWGIWLAGHVAVPVHHQHPKNLILYYANDINTKLIVTSAKYADLMQGVASSVTATLHVLDNKLKIDTLQQKEFSNEDLIPLLPISFYTTQNALILYTSGTTSSPKGVLMSYKNLTFQINCLIEAWKWTQDDCILHTLPLNHVHGIVNALLCPLSVGATTLMLPKFNVNDVWTQLLAANQSDDARRVNVFMAVPTIYSKLIEGYHRMFKEDPKMVAYIKTYMKNKIRLMVSGSAPLPIPIFEQWAEISGHNLLERYGMTETGMVLSNPYVGERIPGSVGKPLPGVSVKLVQDAEAEEITDLLSYTENKTTYTPHLDKSKPIIGDLMVKSDGVFSTYLNRKSNQYFSNNYFITGDVAAYHPDKDYFKILGRKSADIIKSGGHKVSALEIETEIMKNPKIKECAVVGKPDPQWGEIVCVIAVSDIPDLNLEMLQEMVKSTVPSYALPRLLKVVDEIPKNNMGKVNKKKLVADWFDEKFVANANKD